LSRYLLSVAPSGQLWRVTVSDGGADQPDRATDFAERSEAEYYATALGNRFAQDGDSSTMTVDGWPSSGRDWSALPAIADGPETLPAFPATR
jgi:hypothetical protein